MSLFVLASKDGWVNIMYHGLDAVGVDQQVPEYKLLWFYEEKNLLFFLISVTLFVSFPITT